MVTHTRTRKLRKLTSTVISAALLAGLLPQTVLAGDTWPFKGDSAHGANQPNVHGYTSNQIADWSPQTDPDAELLRSRVPLQSRIASFKATQANPKLSPDVQMMNVAGDYGNAFIENAPYTNKFAQYHFNFWQYVDYYSYWHGTATAYTPPEYYDDLAQSDWQQKWFEFGMLNIPNPTYTDAAHKNGVMSLAGVFFSNNDRGQQTYKQMIVKDENGNFPVAEKMIEMAQYFGYDGYFLNQEEVSPNVATADIPDYIAFMKVLQKGGLYVQWYDSLTTNNGSNTFTRTFSNNNISMLYDKTAKEPVSNSFFFDYGVNSTHINTAIGYLAGMNEDEGTNYNLFDIGFAGLEAGRDRFKSVQGTALKDKLTAAGAPRLSIATLGADFVHAGLDEDMGQSWPVSKRTENGYQWMTNLREQLWWSGPNVNPGNTTVSATNTAADVYADNRYWPGISSVIAERSVVQDSNFYTNFNTGHGISYYVNGVKSNEEEWSNMSLQDIPVTWQWWQDTQGNRLTVDYDYGPEYEMTGNTRMNYEQIGGFNGGSSLVVNGALDKENFLRLYKSDLSVKATSKLSLTYNKTSEGDASVISAGLIFKDNPAKVVKVPVENSGEQTSGWVTADVNLGAYAGKEIAAFGLVFTPGADTISDYQVNIGQIRIADGSAVKPAAPTNLAVTQAIANTDEMILKWDLNSDYSKVKQYNVYVNDIFMGGKYDETFYIKQLPAKSGIIKVVPVGADGLEGDAATVSYNLDSAVSGIEVESSANGDFLVKWSGSGAAGNVKVTVKSVNWISTAAPVSRQLSLPQGTTSALFSDMPVNGDEYTVTIQAGNSDIVTHNGTFIDKQAQPYAEAWSWNGNTLNLPMPTTRDWRYMYVYEDGAPKSFAVTYFSGTAAQRPMIIRGRTTKASLSFTSTKAVTVVMEDYSGNKSQPLQLDKRYNVTFNSNGGQPKANVVQVMNGALVTAPNVAREGYVLEGWYNGNVRWHFATDTVGGPLTLQAKWTALPPAVQVVSEGSFRAGQSGVLQAVGKGAGTLTYAWYADRGEGYGEAIDISDKLMLTELTEEMSGYRYKVIVTGEGGLTAEQEYVLQVLPAETNWVTPAFVMDLPPLMETVAGEPVVLAVDTTGDIASIGWEMKRAADEEWQSLPNVTGAVYHMNPGYEEDGTSYRVVLTGKEAAEPARIVSSPLELKVYPLHDAPAIASFTATSQSVTEGNDVTFTVVADSVYGELGYSWFKDDLAIEGALGSSLTIAGAALTDTGIYKARVENTRIVGGRPYVDAADTEGIQLTVNAQPVSPTNPPAAPTNPPAAAQPAATPVPVPAATPAAGAAVITAAQLGSPAVNGVVTVQTGNAVTMELPVNAGELLGTNTLGLQGDGAVFELAPELLKQLAEAVPAAQGSGAKIVLKAEFKALAQAALKTEAGVSLKGRLLDYDLNLTLADGTVKRPGSSAAPVKISWPAGEGLDPKLLGLYLAGSDGTLNYLGGTTAAGNLTAGLAGTGTYALLEYNKQFSDVPAAHWAFDALRVLSAKHLIKGVTEQAYQPGRNITRAEFVQLMAGALQLKGSGTVSFADVPAGAWYQDALSGMVQAGLITGRTPESFQPGAEISREEMTVILMRAYRLQHDTIQAAPAGPSMTDAASISDWAAEHVAAAASLGLVKGRADGTFAPKAPATRAEAAQILLNYLN
ncbi:endo-beta-N-acetylglucosaminidase [Paenibacillus sp. MMS20-IR301]|uniref:endo-beta-N-acetylglucosaminidase n=1 Tax=Paenibacillus sp. MMS20-IR301 TaxID=2895946 RepID=UPI0028E1C349|nr:S-layer homology domain-containing protein [Paenibacillus sp. MMS20-IR301]WNS44085.1 S-layer homology domain-containing protein [Paenibacillus sp. MMS20-IR301]